MFGVIHHDNVPGPEGPFPLGEDRGHHFNKNSELKRRGIPGADEPPLAHFANPLLEKLPRLSFVIGMRALTVLLSSVAVRDPVRRNPA